MPQSNSYLLLHVIFSTKDREPVLSAPARIALHAYLATVARDIGCECYRAGGVEDHVHLAIRLSRTVTVAKLVEKSKAPSSKWLKDEFPEQASFAWQRGYGAFSIGTSQLEALRTYIDKREKHHRKCSFQAEYRLLLGKYGISCDERYVWD